VFVRTTNHISALDLDTGNLLWQSSSLGEAGFSFPLKMHNDFLLVPESDGMVAAFAAKTGSLIWRICQVTTCEPGTWEEITSVSTSESTVIITRYDWDVSNYDINTGDLRWEDDLPNRTFAFGTADRATAYISAGHFLKSYSIENGNLVWEDSFGSYLGEIITGDTDALYLIYEADNDNVRLAAIDITSRKVQWDIKFPNANLPISYNHLALDSEKGYLYTAGQTVAQISVVDGSIIWETDKLGGTLEHPIPTKDRVYVRTRLGTLFVLADLNGNIIGDLSLNNITAFGAHYSEISPAVSDKFLIVPYGQSSVVALQP